MYWQSGATFSFPLICVQIVAVNPLGWEATTVNKNPGLLVISALALYLLDWKVSKSQKYSYIKKIPSLSLFFISA